MIKTVFERLFESTKDFHVRFRGKDNMPPLKSLLQSVNEELDELKFELLRSAQGGSHKGLVAEEAIDVIVGIFGCLIDDGVDLDDLLHAATTVIEKNDTKTETTHYLRDDGKVARRNKN